MSLRRKILIIFVIVSMLMVVSISGFVSYIVESFSAELTSPKGEYAREIIDLYDARIQAKIQAGDRLESFVDDQSTFLELVNFSSLDIVLASETVIDENLVAKKYEYQGDTIVLYDTEDHFRLVDQARFWFSPVIGFATVMLMLQVFVLYLLFRWVLKPLKNLEDGTREIANGNLLVKLPKYRAQDEIGRLFTSFDQMRDRLREDEELRKLYETNRTQLIGNISHDLKTPLAAIKGYSTGIIEGVANTPEKLERYAKVIQTNASSMDVMLNDLMTMSSLELDSAKLVTDRINVCQFFNDFFDEWEYELEEKNIHFSTVISVEQHKEILGDRHQLMRVINNLMSNAIKYMNKEKQKIKIEVVEQRSNLVIKVTDNGMGIPSEKIGKVFERFYRVDEARSRNIEGSGLGLSIVKNIVELHRGTIKMDSIEAVGTTVIITLPM